MTTKAAPSRPEQAKKLEEDDDFIEFDVEGGVRAVGWLLGIAACCRADACSASRLEGRG